jgi:hypothetical protein
MQITLIAVLNRQINIIDTQSNLINMLITFIDLINIQINLINRYDKLKLTEFRLRWIT